MPGYVEPNLAPIGSRPPITWAVGLLPYLGREDLWEEWRAAQTCPLTMPIPPEYRPPECNVARAFHLAPPNLPQFVCPDAASMQQIPLSYVANCGLPDGLLPVAAGNPPDSIAYAVHHDLFCYRTPHLSSDGIKDGASETVLLSENLQASESVKFAWQPFASLLELTEADVGMVWWPDPLPTDAFGRVVGILINNDRLQPLPLPAGKERLFARPSSNHPGGVNVAFADTHVEFVSQDISYRTWQERMTPDDATAIRNGLFVPEVP